MILDHKLVVVMLAYNAERTLRQTNSELPLEYGDEVVLVDDASSDWTVRVAGNSAFGQSSIRLTPDMAPIRKPATAPRWNWVSILSSWCTRINSILLDW